MPDVRKIRVMHVSMLGVPLSSSPGFKSQLAAEWCAGESIRTSSTIDWRTVLLVPDNNDEKYDEFRVPVLKIPKLYRGRLLRRLYLWRYVQRAAKQNDVVLVRHSVVDPFESLCIRLLPNVAVVHHTKTVEELSEMGHSVLSRVEAGLRWLNRRWARWPIGVTAELSQDARGRGCFAASDLVLPNGINLSTVSSLATNRRENSDIHVIFVASRFVSWHGLDRLFDALQKWSPRSKDHLTVHLVGDLTDAHVLASEQLRSEWLEVRIHGRLEQEEIAELTAQVDVGIGSLALDRNGMKDACTLKVRDYLAAGLSVYSGHRDSGLPDDFPYYLHVKSVDVKQLIEFALKSREVDRQSVRLAAEPYISKEAIMRRVGDGILREIQRNERCVSALHWER